MTSVAIFSLLPKEYGLVTLAASSTFLLHIYQITTVSKYRKAAKIAYPQHMAEKAQMDANPDAVVYNCAQRAHANTLEALPQMMFGILFNGLVYPKTSALLGFGWVIGRVLFTYGYTTGKPEARYSYGGALHVFSLLGTTALALFISAKHALTAF